MTKTNIGRSLFALIALFFIGNGLVLMLSPTSILDHMLLGSLESVPELSSIRALLGGAIFAVWATVLFGAIRANSAYILVGVISLSATIFARLVGYLVDGSFPEFAFMTIPPVIALVLMLIAHKLMVGSPGNVNQRETFPA
ncbi:MAG: hypothetical protein GKR90_22560 [Pseudomonadales bacterium]|nr:hypothetical protein [Pseudomonadales bacterium]